MGNGTECTLSKFADDTGGVAYTPDGCAAIQRDLSRLEKWVERNLIQFNTVLHWDRNNHMHQYTLPGWKETLQKRTWGPGGQHGYYEPAMYPCGKGIQWYPALCLGKVLPAG